MRIYFAPLQGSTNREYRQLHAMLFGGIQKYYTPFVSPTKVDHLTGKEREELLPLPGICTVPQVLCSDPEAFLAMAGFAQEAGFEEINLNLGCPSGTVTAKGKGAGLLRSRLTLELFLDRIFEASPLPISIKTRMGWESTEEYVPLLELLKSYPVFELTVHARTRDQAYTGTPYRQLFLEHLGELPFPAVYNGDLFSPGAVRESGLMDAPVSALMIGRGLLANPALARTLAGGTPLTAQELFRFHDAIYEKSLARLGPSACLGRMREVDKYMACCFQDVHKVLKKMRKATNLARYNEAYEGLRDLPLRQDPGFDPEL